MTDIDSLIQLAEEKITKLSTKILNAKSNDESYGFIAEQEIHYFWLSKLKELKQSLPSKIMTKHGEVTFKSIESLAEGFAAVLKALNEQSLPQTEAGNQDGWISVEERLPEMNKEVLCAHSFSGNRFICYYTNDCTTENVDGWHGGAMPTHWMPLPKAPDK